MRSIIYLSLLVLTVLAPISAFSAESFKLRFLTTISVDEKEGILKTPEGVACNDQSQVVVADTGNGRILRYTFQDKVLTGGSELKVEQIIYPVKVQFGTKGDIFVLDGKLRKVVHLNPDGTFAGFVEPVGVTAPEKYAIRSFKADSSNNVYLLDIAGERVLRVDISGKLLGQIPFPKNYGFISDLAVTVAGDVVLLDSVGSKVYIAKKDTQQFVPFTKELRDYMNFPSFITASSRSGDIYLLDQYGGAIVSIGPDGSFQGRQLSLGWKAGQLYYPAQMCINKNGEFFIADRGNGRIQILENVK
ncbi:MAG: NHL repeat-containing protein [Geobacteraceae bacterium]